MYTQLAIMNFFWYMQNVMSYRSMVLFMFFVFDDNSCRSQCDGPATPLFEITGMLCLHDLDHDLCSACLFSPYSSLYASIILTNSSYTISRRIVTGIAIAPMSQGARMHEFMMLLQPFSVCFKRQAKALVIAGRYLIIFGRVLSLIASILSACAKRARK